MTFFLKRVWLSVLFGLSVLLTPVLTEHRSSVARATGAADKERLKIPQQYKDIKWAVGGKPASPALGVPICQAKNALRLYYKLAVGYIVLYERDVEAFSKIAENPKIDACGIFARSDMKWYALIEPRIVGYIADVGTINPDRFMATLKERLVEENAERAKEGWAPLEIVDWAVKPSYDDAEKRLTYATKQRAGERELIRYETVAMIWRGYVEVSMITSVKDMNNSIKEFNARLKDSFEIPHDLKYNQASAQTPKASKSLTEFLDAN